MFVYLFESFEDRHHYGEDLFLAERCTLLLEILREVDTLFILHHEIGGIVGLKVVQDLDDGGVVEYGATILGVGLYTVFTPWFALMMIWNFVTVSSVSTANAQVESLAGPLQDAKSLSQQYSSLKQDVDQLKLKVDTIKMTGSNIDIAATLAEISYLIGDRIALNKIILKSEPLAPDNSSKGNAVRSAGNLFKGQEKHGKNRFKIFNNFRDTFK